MLLSISYQTVRYLTSFAAVLLQRHLAKNAEVLVLRHENALLRRQIAQVRYTRTDRVRLSTLSRPIPRRRWTEVFVPAIDDPDPAPQTDLAEVGLHGTTQARTPTNHHGGPKPFGQACGVAIAETRLGRLEFAAETPPPDSRRRAA